MIRVLTAAVGILLILAVTTLGPRWLFAGMVLMVASLALDEFLMMVSRAGVRRPGRWWLVPGAAVTLSFGLRPLWSLWTLLAGLLLLGAVSIGSGQSKRFEYLGSGMTGIVYASLLPGFLLWMTPEALWVVLATVWAGDAAAYYGGRSLGRRRLAPVVSPNKTVEGAVAGGIGSLFIGGTIGWWLLPVPLPVLGGICLMTGIVGQIGDLAESRMKRAAGVKDSGTRLPGHGGVLDRVDSLLFAAPTFQFLVLWAT